MGNGRERSKREMFMEEKEKLHYPEWIDALKEEELCHNCKGAFFPHITTTNAGFL